MNALHIHVTGVVQGVGFRPFVYGLAARLALTGWVRNTSAGVDLEVNGDERALQDFLHALKNEPPPLARIDSLTVEPCPPNGYTTFEIIASQDLPQAFQPVSPDVATCPDCLRELFDPSDLHYRYPFTNCTNCGPRFTLITALPYDRPNTTMAGFPLCPECAREYHDPLDRRFHAQPVACPVCGPQVWLENSTSGPDSPLSRGDSAILEVQRLLADGKIVAIKGLGGFHLACDAENPAAVSELRRRKLRVDKPFALMMADLATVETRCFLTGAERGLLESSERPIVILHRRPGSTIAADVAPQQDTLGVMLPYTPLHYLLFTVHPDGAGQPPQSLVMTSGNLSEEPIAVENDEARRRLSILTDAFLMHDRPIRTRCDDSVVRLAPGGNATSLPLQAKGNQGRNGLQLLPLRRSRGYAPFPVRLSGEGLPLLATGAELKNTFCLARGTYAFLSHHIGDLENYATLQSFEDGVAQMESLFRVQPEAIAYDLHPDYLATRYALERAGREDLPALGVQHHHAHIAACVAENSIDDGEPVIGVAFDGSGYGPDGAIWGGEFLLATTTGYQRAFHLAYVPLPGGDRAIRQPWRTALAWLMHAGVEWSPDLPPIAIQPAQANLTVLRRQIETGVNAPLTSSLGRLFDAIAALLGVRQVVNYEAQAAIELEALVDSNETGTYPFETELITGLIDPSPLIQALVGDLLRGIPQPILAARFHNSVAEMVRQVCVSMRSIAGSNRVALSGGVWQNITVLGKTLPLLEAEGFNVFTHRLVPPNDGGLALGQVAIARRHFKG